MTKTSARRAGITPKTESALPVSPMTMFVGGRHYPIASLADASRMYEEARDASGMGASEIGAAPLIFRDGEIIAHVSYNGRVWPGTPDGWQVGMSPIYDNRR